ncbi:uncharacterized protein [Dysidea avara]|uniref:uncharacterized protein n=1 Tax=Dysidea avara TaxID=196820 RepID=UPI00332046AD
MAVCNMSPVALHIPPSLQDRIIDNIELGIQIGRGANGRILEAKWERTEVAVKEIHSIFINEVSEPEFQAFKQSFLRECEQSSRLHHPNIVRFFGIYFPPGARVPSLVMERLHCNLSTLLEQTPVIPIETKLSILYDVSLGVRYLHSRTPPIIHRDLSSNNVLLSKEMEGKIGDLGTLRLMDPMKQSKMSVVPGTMHFMPPEAIVANTQKVSYGSELDVFSFGCVMLHALSHQWPAPTEAVVTDPVTSEMKARSEVERRRSYFDRIDRSRLGVLIPLIESCLSNLPKNRTSIVTLCKQLEDLVTKNTEIQSKNIQMQHHTIEKRIESPAPRVVPVNVDQIYVTKQRSSPKVRLHSRLFGNSPMKQLRAKSEVGERLSQPLPASPKSIKQRPVNVVGEAAKTSYKNIRKKEIKSLDDTFKDFEDFLTSI